MGLLDKLKNVFFEEEYVEVEEDEKSEPKEKVAVAKKIENPDVKVNEEEKKEKLFADDEPVKKVEEAPKEHRFPMTFDDKDFEVEKTIELDEPVRENMVVEAMPEIKEEYKEPVVEVEKREYRYDREPEEVVLETREEKSTYHGLYEGSKDKEEKPVFTPSPIISPIYGILNKNYKKEEIVTKTEIRLSQASSKKADLDVVREKAYGDLANDISLSIEDDGKKEEKVEKEDLLYDLNEDESPTVKVVTVGDAEEYFNDLGLEYNVDYKVEKKEEKEEKHESKAIKKEENKMHLDDSHEDDKNLFDLIDSMYEDKE
ncbi:MAG: hypothetical protein IJ568_06100 [Bacilli bacterium]|nr:hypothetical protein [Bacilli bacterium]